MYIINTTESPTITSIQPVVGGSLPLLCSNKDKKSATSSCDWEKNALDPTQYS